MILEDDNDEPHIHDEYDNAEEDVYCGWEGNISDSF